MLNHHGKYYILKTKESHSLTDDCIEDVEVLFFSTSDIFCLFANKFALVGKSSELILDPDN
jgi:hypothetical protein